MGFVRPSIHQALALGALNDPRRARRVIDAKSSAVRISEIELRQIAVKMLFAAMLIHPLHPALEDRIEAFDGVRRDDLVALAAHIFIV